MRNVFVVRRTTKHTKPQQEPALTTGSVRHQIVTLSSKHQSESRNMGDNTYREASIRIATGSVKGHRVARHQAETRLSDRRRSSEPQSGNVTIEVGTAMRHVRASSWTQKGIGM